MTEREIQFTRVDVGNSSDKKNLLDAPPGKWTAQAKVTLKATKGDGYPMFQVDFKLLDAKTPGNEEFVGRRVSEYLVLFPRGHKAYQMSMRKLHGLCACADVPIPDFGVVESKEDLQPFIDSIDGAKFDMWTATELNRESGEERTVCKYEAPRVFGGGGAMRPGLDDGE